MISLQVTLAMLLRMFAKRKVYLQDVEESVEEADLESRRRSLPDLEDRQGRPKFWQTLAQRRDLAMQRDLERKRSIPDRIDRKDRPKVWQALKQTPYIVTKHELERRPTVSDLKDRKNREVWQAITQVQDVTKHIHHEELYDSQFAAMLSTEITGYESDRDSLCSDNEIFPRGDEDSDPLSDEKRTDSISLEGSTLEVLHNVRPGGHVNITVHKGSRDFIEGVTFSRENAGTLPGDELKLHCEDCEGLQKGEDFGEGYYRPSEPEETQNRVRSSRDR